MNKILTTNCIAINKCKLVADVEWTLKTAAIHPPSEPEAYNNSPNVA
jgi:hypothetical protein